MSAPNNNNAPSSSSTNAAGATTNNGAPQSNGQMTQGNGGVPPGFPPPGMPGMPPMGGMSGMPDPMMMMMMMNAMAQQQGGQQQQQQQQPQPGQPGMPPGFMMNPMMGMQMPGGPQGQAGQQGQPGQMGMPNMAQQAQMMQMMQAQAMQAAMQQQLMQAYGQQAPSQQQQQLAAQNGQNPAQAMATALAQQQAAMQQHQAAMQQQQQQMQQGQGQAAQQQQQAPHQASTPQAQRPPMASAKPTIPPTTTTTTTATATTPAAVQTPNGASAAARNEDDGVLAPGKQVAHPGALSAAEAAVVLSGVGANPTVVQRRPKRRTPTKPWGVPSNVVIFPEPDPEVETSGDPAIPAFSQKIVLHPYSDLTRAQQLAQHRLISALHPAEAHALLSRVKTDELVEPPPLNHQFYVGQRVFTQVFTPHRHTMYHVSNIIKASQYGLRGRTTTTWIPNLTIETKLCVRRDASGNIIEVLTSPEPQVFKGARVSRRHLIGDSALLMETYIGSGRNQIPDLLAILRYLNRCELSIRQQTKQPFPITDQGRFHSNSLLNMVAVQALAPVPNGDHQSESPLSQSERVPAVKAEDTAVATGEEEVIEDPELEQPQVQAQPGLQPGEEPLEDNGANPGEEESSRPKRKASLASVNPTSSGNTSDNDTVTLNGDEPSSKRPRRSATRL